MGTGVELLVISSLVSAGGAIASGVQQKENARSASRPSQCRR